MKKNDIWTIPNMLTVLRILFVPVFIYLYLKGHYGASAVVILICGFTDFLDGYVARHYHQVSKLGKALDPFADKLLQFAIIFCLIFTIDNMIWLFLLFLIKEASMLICWFILKKKGGSMNGAMWFGKISTAVFYIAMFVLVALPIQDMMYAWILMIVTAFFLLLSFILYMKTYFSLFHDLKR